MLVRSRFNLADRLNVINFSAVFSGTALAPPRQATFQLKSVLIQFAERPNDH
jgi:hypothetical protein